MGVAIDPLPLAELAPAGIICLDSNLKIVFVNRWLEARTGLSRTELLSRRLHETSLPGPLVELWARVARDVLAKRRTSDIEYLVKLQAGEEWHWCLFVPELSEDGSTKKVLMYVRDVTERKQIELAIRQRAAELRAVMASFPDLHFWVDDDGTIRNYNAGARPYRTPEEFMGRRMQDVLPPDVGAMFANAFSELRETGRSKEIEYVLPLPDGLCWYEARFAVLPNKQFLIVVRDVTARKETEAQKDTSLSELRQTLKEIHRMRGGVSLCTTCRKVRHDGSGWISLEEFCRTRLKVDFLEQICPHCQTKK